jgi:hypothetical protein
MRNLLLTSLLSAAVGAALAYWLYPRVEVQTEIKERTVVQNDIRTIIRTVERPDGTKETVKEVVDNSTQQMSKDFTAKVAKKPQWILTAGAGSALSPIEVIYSASVARRVIGPIFAGAYGRTDGELGLTVGLEF